MERVRAHFIRHGQTDFNKDRRITGQVDIPLNEEGVAQAKDAHLAIPEECTHIISSDLLRCRQTAKAANLRNLPIAFDARLRERNFGTLEGRPWDEADPTGEIWEKDKEQRYDYRPYGGESVEDVEKRVLEALADAREGAKEKGTPLIVTHGGVVRLLHHRLGTPQSEIGNASVHTFELPE